MKKNNFYKSFLPALILFGMFITNFSIFAESDQIKIFQSVIDSPVCNNDGTCDIWRGENSTNCPADCGIVIPPTPTGGGAIFIPPFSPKAKSIVINDDSTYTNYQNVTLSLSAEKAVQMAISNNKKFSDSVWEEYKTFKNWMVDSGDGEKIVYVKFRSKEGGESEVISDTIILDTIAPANVENFEATGEDLKINLKWKNPDKDFVGAKIMRSTEFYPASPDEGQLVYNNIGGYYVDLNVKNGTRYYYTAFVYDEAGNYSSGAIASATPQKPLLPGEKPTEIMPFPEDIMSKITPPEEIARLLPKDFIFLQGDKEIPFLDFNKTKLNAMYGEPLTISIPYEKFPEVLKTIMVTLEKPSWMKDDDQKIIDKKTFSFLLRVNKEKTAYLATLVPPEPGEYPLKITILDYKNNSLKKITGGLLVSPPVIPAAIIPWYKKLFEKPYITYIYIILVAIIFYLSMEYLLKRKKMRIVGKSEK